jgi:hypothetical protein
MGPYAATAAETLRDDVIIDTKYLGHILSADGSNVPDVENRIAQMRAAFNRHTHLWKSTLMDIHLKFEMYEAMLAILIICRGNVDVCVTQNGSAAACRCAVRRLNTSSLSTCWEGVRRDSFMLGTISWPMGKLHSFFARIVKACRRRRLTKAILAALWPSIRKIRRSSSVTRKVPVHPDFRNL